MGAVILAVGLLLLAHLAFAVGAVIVLSEDFDLTPRKRGLLKLFFIITGVAGVAFALVLSIGFTLFILTREAIAEVRGETG